MLFQSFAKNFGVYGERAGCLSIVTDSKKETDVVMSRIKQIARPIYSNPPIHGARLVDTVLSSPELTAEWHQELRKGLVQGLKDAGSTHNWKHITD